MMAIEETIVRAAPRAPAGPDTAWLESEYDLRRRHPDHEEEFARWRTASALVQRIESFRADVRYGEGAGETLDVYPSPRDGAPVLVFIHGGYWRSLDKADHAFIAPPFTAAGALVVMPNYALCPAVGIEHIALQMTRALAWVHRHAALYGGDPRRIVVAGHSAGAHLAAMLLCCRWKDVAPDLPPQLFTAALAISGVYDLEPLRLAPFVQSDLRLTASAVRRRSPAFFPRPRRPLIAAVGAGESREFRRQTALLRDQWGPTGVPVCETIPDVNHYTILYGLADPRGRLHELALRLLGLH